VLAAHRGDGGGGGAARRRSAACGDGDAAQRQGADDIPIPPAPYLERKVRDVPHLTEVWSYINPFMLYGRHLGYKGNFERRWRSASQGARAVPPDGGSEARSRAQFMKVRAVWQFFEAERAGNSIHLFAPGAKAHAHVPLRPAAARRRAVPERLHSGSRGRAARPPGAVRGDGGRGRPRASEEWKQAGEFFKAHAIQALAIETAEGAAEWLHRRIREDWGFPDPPTMTMHDRFTSKYRGKRYSFGYPACPNLDDQQGLWKPAASRRHRRATHRRHDDGAGGERERAGVPSPGLRVLYGG
jgi:5-methyltetrahydrofolate--homocysteine methyltransferase